MTWPPQSNAVELRKVLAPYMPPPPSPPPPSPFDWGRPEWLQETLGAAFEFAFETGTLYHRVPDGEAGCEVMATGFGPVKALAESLDDEKWAAAKAGLVAFFERFHEGIGVAMPLDYLIAVGTRR